MYWGKAPSKIVLFCCGVLEATVAKGQFVEGDVTPLKTNMSPEEGDHFKRKGGALPTIIFQGTFVSFLGKVR